MNQCDVDQCDPRIYHPFAFQTIIESGIREVVANKQDGFRLKLSNFFITPSNTRDLNLICSTNKYTVHSLLGIFGTSLSSLSRDKQTPHFEVNLSSCHKLKWLDLRGKDIWLRDAASSATSKHPVLIINSVDQYQCVDPRPVLPSIERIDVIAFTCSSTWLHSLFSTLLTCDHEVVCTMKDCYTNSHDEYVSYIFKTGKHTFNMYITYDSIGLWEILRGLNIQSLTLRGRIKRLGVRRIESLLQSLSSLKQLDTLTIGSNTILGLLKALNGLNIRSLIVRSTAYQAHLADPPPVLPSIEHIELRRFTCSYTWLCSLFNTLPTLDQEVTCQLEQFVLKAQSADHLHI
ncbi:uncharacterized protein LOC127833609 [Dreissena polymorpha]|uniref:uncharacterized protein LOC127833609 n=1 Tax=Dreissena polymorpha TaxID=45954 RepID=UPI00226561CD|nr:uncharacterized protein LOC127833609 [Dreissena polymorpha]